MESENHKKIEPIEQLFEICLGSGQTISLTLPEHIAYEGLKSGYQTSVREALSRSFDKTITEDQARRYNDAFLKAKNSLNRKLNVAGYTIETRLFKVHDGDLEKLEPKYRLRKLEKKEISNPDVPYSSRNNSAIIFSQGALLPRGTSMSADVYLRMREDLEEYL